MSELQTDINKILTNGDLSAKEKIDKLEMLKASYAGSINAAISGIKAEFTFCPKCKEYYRNNTWATKWIERTHLVCTNPNMGYLEKYEYEERTDTVSVKECPRGHQI